MEDSPAGLYCGEDGDRGVMALQDIARGQEVFRVPLRLALTDHSQDKESNALMFEVGFEIMRQASGAWTSFRFQHTSMVFS